MMMINLVTSLNDGGEKPNTQGECGHEDNGEGGRAGECAAVNHSTGVPPPSLGG